MGNINNCCNEKLLSDEKLENKYKFEKNWNNVDLIKACEKLKNEWKKNTFIKSKNNISKKDHIFKKKINKYKINDQKLDIKNCNPYLYFIKKNHKEEFKLILENNTIENFHIYETTNYFYQGIFNDNDEKDGIGRKYNIKNDYYFEGNFIKNKFNGLGFWYNKDFYYIGNFLNSKFHGYGFYSTFDGLIYIGSFINNNFEGEGLLILPNKKGFYKGNFMNGKKDGYGELNLKNKGVFKGNFRENKMNGKGIYTFYNRNCYLGNFNNNKADGEGIFIYTNGTVYEGCFKNFKKEGKGKLVKFKKTFSQLLNEKNNEYFKSMNKENTSNFNNELDIFKIELPFIRIKSFINELTDYISIDERLKENENFNFIIEGYWKNYKLDDRNTIKYPNNKIVEIYYIDGVEKFFNKLTIKQINLLNGNVSKNINNKISIYEFNSYISIIENLEFYFLPYLIYLNEEEEFLLDDFYKFSKDYYKRKEYIIKRINHNMNLEEIIWKKLEPILLQIQNQNLFSLKNLKSNIYFNELIYKENIINLLEKLDISKTDKINILIIKEIFLSTDEFKLKLKCENDFNYFKNFIISNNLENKNKIRYIKVLKFVLNNNNDENEKIINLLKLSLINQNQENDIEEYLNIIKDYYLNENFIFYNLTLKIEKIENWLNINKNIFKKFDKEKIDTVNIEFLVNNKKILKNEFWKEYLEFIKFNELLIDNNKLNNQNIIKKLKEILNYWNNELKDILFKMNKKYELNGFEINIIKEIFNNIDESFNILISLQEFILIKNLKNDDVLAINKLFNLYKIKNIFDDKVIFIKDLIYFFKKNVDDKNFT